MITNTNVRTENTDLMQCNLDWYMRNWILGKNGMVKMAQKEN